MRKRNKQSIVFNSNKISTNMETIVDYQTRDLQSIYQFLSIEKSVENTWKLEWYNYYICYELKSFEWNKSTTLVLE